MTIAGLILDGCIAVESATRWVAEKAYNHDARRRNVKTMRNHRQVIEDLRDPELIVAVLAELGWYRVGDDHRSECPRMVDRGNLCNCVPDAPTWSAPKEVYEHLGETWEDRLAARRALTGD